MSEEKKGLITDISINMKNVLAKYVIICYYNYCCEPEKNVKA